jgi:hypothetical protein
LDIGTRNFMLKTATILGRMLQSRSRSTRDSDFPPGSYRPAHHAAIARFAAR